MSDMAKRKLTSYDPEDKAAFQVGHLRPDLAKRAPSPPRGLIAKRDLERYYRLLDRELATLGLETGDLVVIAKALRDREFNLGNFDLIASIIEEHSDDGRRVARRLREATATQLMAVVDAVERYRLQAEYMSPKNAALVALGGDGAAA